MKLSILFSLAFAICMAQDLVTRDIEGEYLNEDDVVLTEADLDALEASLVARSPAGPPVVERPVSTKCAAVPRNNYKSRRGVSAEQNLDWAYDVEKRDASGQCGAMGCLMNPGKRTFILGIKQQRCENTCVCRPETAGGAGCMATTWMPNNKGLGRGRCILYTKSISSMGFSTDACNEYHPSRTIYSRSCFHKGNPSEPDKHHTKAMKRAAEPTGLPMKRDTDLNTHLLGALAGL